MIDSGKGYGILPGAFGQWYDWLRPSIPSSRRSLEQCMSAYASFICPLSPLMRSLIVAAVVLLALVHIRLMSMLERWLSLAPPGAASRRFIVMLLAGAHVDAALVAGFGAFNAAAEASCGTPAAGATLRLMLPMAGALAMVLFAWILLLPHVKSRTQGGS
jgi:hypothetical protein